MSTSNAAQVNHPAPSSEARTRGGTPRARTWGIVHPPTLVRWFGLSLMLLFFLFPIVYLITVSLKSQPEIVSGRLWPETPRWENWPNAFRASALTLFLRNSIVIGLSSVVLTLGIAVPATYAMVRYHAGGKALYSIVLGSYIAPPVVAMLPLFFLLRRLGGIDTHWGVALVHALASVPVAVWLLDSFVRAVPREVEEAAWVDGASQFGAFTRIVIPLISPGIVAAGIICFILSYNEFLFALTLTYRAETQPLPVGLSLFQGDRLVQFGQMAAASLTGMAPVYVLALFFQRWLIRGLTHGAVK